MIARPPPVRRTLLSAQWPKGECEFWACFDAVATCFCHINVMFIFNMTNSENILFDCDSNEMNLIKKIFSCSVVVMIMR